MSKKIVEDNQTKVDKEAESKAKDAEKAAAKEAKKATKKAENEAKEAEKAAAKEAKKAEKSADKEAKKAEKEAAKQEKESRYPAWINRERKRLQNLKWNKLDNTANIFPVIARQGMSNVYRVSVTLKEEIDPNLLQEALENVLPYFDVFQCCLKRGLFWYYFEQNPKPLPKVQEEHTYPCMYINPHGNQNYLFRVSYYKRRINLEVFHAVTDGSGGFAFLKELTYQYLRLAHSELQGKVHSPLSGETSLNNEDSYVQNYKHPSKKQYRTRKAVEIKGEKLPINQCAVIHGKLDAAGVKAAAKKYGVTINQYLVGVYMWSIYKAYLKEQVSKRPITTCVPVNLRPYFESDTNKNFFAVVTADFLPEMEAYTLEEVMAIVAESLGKQITKDNLEKLLSYNVSNEQNMFLRLFPLTIKEFAMRQVYNMSAKANTTTLTNMGVMTSNPLYDDYIEAFQAILGMSKGQNIKATVVTYKGILHIAFCSNFRETNIQRTFFRQLVSDGVDVTIETNGVFYE